MTLNSTVQRLFEQHHFELGTIDHLETSESVQNDMQFCETMIPLSKKLDCPQVLTSAGVLEPIFHGSWGELGLRCLRIVNKCLKIGRIKGAVWKTSSSYIKGSCITSGQELFLDILAL